MIFIQRIVLLCSAFIIFLINVCYSEVNPIGANSILNIEPTMFQSQYTPFSDGTTFQSPGGSFYWTLPFNITYDNYTYNQINVVASGGRIGMLYNRYWNNSSWIYNIGYTTSGIHAFSVGLYPNGRGLYGDRLVRYKVTGSAPYRVAIIQWEHCAFDFWPDYPGDVNFQIRLYETINWIDVAYGKIDNYGFNAFNSSFYRIHAGITGYRGSYSSSPYIPYRYEYLWLDQNAGQFVWNSAVNTDAYPYYTSNKDIGRSNLVFKEHIGMFKNIEGYTIRYANYPKILSTYPLDNLVLQRGKTYSPPSENPSVFVKRKAGQPTVAFNYKISGPKPSTNIIYQVTNCTPLNQDAILVGDNVRYNFTSASGSCAGSNGELVLPADLQTGIYEIEAEMTFTGVSGYSQKVISNCVVPVDYDIELAEIVQPVLKAKKKYTTSGVPIEIKVRNFGKNNISRFKIKVKIYKDTIKVYDREVDWNNSPPNDFKSGASLNINFPNFSPTLTGDYSIIAEVEITGQTDQLLTNNILPRQGQSSMLFNIAQAVDLRAVAVVSPNTANEVWVGRPINITGRFTNRGASDCSNDSIFIDIVRTAGPDTVHKDTVINYLLTALSRDTIDVPFSKYFIPQFVGQYIAYLRVKSPDDTNPSGKNISLSFQVLGGLYGTYTIGSGSAGRNFTDIQSAVDALYLRGVREPVVFEFTDRDYTIGNIHDKQYPAIDLSSRIFGANQANTITFKPSSARSNEKGGNNSGVTINLFSGSGIGVLMGQNLYPANTYAIVNQVASKLIPYYANTSGYITFDGGSNKTFRILLNTPTDENKFQAGFYLQKGAQNISLKNMIFENASFSSQTPNCLLPCKRYVNPNFEYEQDINSNNSSYSSAIILRTIPPMDRSGMNSYGLDTLPCINNLVSDNEISGFGYGIVSLGAGALFQDRSGIFKRYYNKNNTFSKNQIHDISRAGIFLGFEENTTISNNKIYSVLGICSDNFEAAGIIAGGEQKVGWNGYNNIGLTISGNEISELESGLSVYGIKIVQCPVEYNLASQGTKLFPDTSESFKIFNNIIYKLKTYNYSTNRIGLLLGTERQQGSFFVPKMQKYMSRNDFIANNTIEIGSDNGGSSGILACIALQETYNTRVLNNAVAMLDNYFSDQSPVNALIYYQGIMPGKTGGLISDRNAFWNEFWDPPQNESNKYGAAIYGFIEKDSSGNFIEPSNPADYDKNAYEFLRQWTAWTGQDINSVKGDFVDDMIKLGDYPNQKYRIKTPGPKGSVLNNNGFILFEYFTTDIDGNSRSSSNQPYDIGAVEFDGSSYYIDIEVKKISEPYTYKAGSGLFSDAEYIMKSLPINFRVLLRNIGNFSVSKVEVKLKIYMEGSDDKFPENPVAVLIDSVDIASAQSREVTFQLSNSLLKTYADLRNYQPKYNVPKHFDTVMVPNVTPRYKLNLEVQADENNKNNKDSIIVRFYLRKSDSLNTLISTENSFVNIYNLVSGRPPTKDEIAGRLNYNALLDGFHSLGWFPDIDKDSKNKDSLKIDVFDRNGWEPKSVDYTIYKYLWFADADDKPLKSYQRWDIGKYLNTGQISNKKNLILSSQEIVRQNYIIDRDFVRNSLSAMDIAPSNPFGSGVNCHNQSVVGVELGGVKVKILETGFEYNDGTNRVADESPYCGLMGVNSAYSRPACYYEQDKNGSRMRYDSIMGVANTTPYRNVVLLGVDWRHYGNIYDILTTSINYYENNGGTITPIELLDFKAEAISDRVEISWSTASERNSSRFEIEKAELTISGEQRFIKIGEEKAIGNSLSIKHYKPFIDRDVERDKAYLYRLKMVDIDGSFDYSPEKLVEIGGGSIWLGYAKPNPASDYVGFTTNLTTSGKNFNVNIYDLFGRNLNQRIDIGTGNIEIYLNELADGIYYIVVVSDDKAIARQFRKIK